MVFLSQPFVAVRLSGLPSTASPSTVHLQLISVSFIVTAPSLAKGFLIVECSSCTLIAENFAMTSPQILAGQGFSRLLLILFWR
ncbi:hypothetical protein V6Z11_D12G106100 [Gossypium hirsutum]